MAFLLKIVNASRRHPTGVIPLGKIVLDQLADPTG
jgi:hypothetical protein